MTPHKEPIKCYMIVLAGQGDTEIKFVPKETWDWLAERKSAPPERQMLQYLKERDLSSGETEEDLIQDLLSSTQDCRHDNDRALCCAGEYGPGEYGSNTFCSTSSAMKFVRDNNVDIIQEFEGYIY